MSKYIIFFYLLTISVSATPKRIHTWETISTKHFDIIYNQEFEQTAMKVAKFAESSYIPISKSLNYYPTKTSIILRTDNDINNAFATAFPWRIELYVNTPVDNWLGANDDYLKTVFIHEFTHIVNTQKKSGFTEFLSYLVGQNYVAIHKLGEPLWFQEGMAVYNETKYTNGGRLRNPYQLSLFDAAINKTRWDYSKSYRTFDEYGYSSSLDYRNLYESNFYSLLDLPSGMYYDYGSNVINYVSGKYGSGVWEKSLSDYVYNPFLTYDVGIKQRLEHYTRKSIEELDYESRQKYNKPTLQIENRDEDIVNYYTPRWDNGFLYAYKKSVDDYPHIVKFDDGVESKEFDFVSLTDDNAYDVSDNRIAYTSPEMDSRYPNVIHNNIYITDENHSFKLKGSRYFSPDISKISKRVVAVYNEPELSKMLLFSENGDILDSIYDERFRFINPRWSNNEKMLVVTTVDKQSRYNISIYNFEEKKFLPLYTADNFIDNNACFNSDDSYVLYNSDMNGRPNIWAVDISNSQKYLVTNDQFSSMSPDVDGDKLAYITYTVNGYRIRVIDLDYNNFTPESLVVKEMFKPNEYAIKVSDKVAYTKESYSPFKYMLPHSWGLSSYNDFLGVSCIGNDPLKHHEWSLFGMAKFDGSKFVKGDYLSIFYYGYNRFWPKISMYGEYYSDNSYLEEYDDILDLTTTVSFPLKLESGIYSTNLIPSVAVNYFYENIKDIYKLMYNVRNINMETVSLGTSFSRLSFVNNKPLPNSGVSFNTSVNYTSVKLGSNKTSLYNESKLALYIPLINKLFTISPSVDFQYYNNYGTTSQFINLPTIFPKGYGEDDYTIDFDYRRYFFHPNINVTLPLLSVEKKMFFLPIYINYFQFDVFGENIIATDRNKPNEIYYRGVGGELSLATSFFQVFDMKLKYFYSYDWYSKTNKNGFNLFFEN